MAFNAPGGGCDHPRVEVIRSIGGATVGAQCRICLEYRSTWVLRQPPPKTYADGVLRSALEAALAHDRQIGMGPL